MEIKHVKAIKGYVGLYLACSDGSIISIRGEHYRILKPGVSSTGYHVVVLVDKNGIRKTHKVHRLVCAAFKRNPKNLPVVAHADDNPMNNHINNLSWASQSKNMKDCHRRGRSKIPLLNGEKNRHAKLTADNVLTIRACATSSSAYAWAQVYRVSETTIRNIINRKSWKHV